MKPAVLSWFGNSGLFIPICLRSQPSCHASLKFAGYSNLLNGDTLKMSNLKLSQPGVYAGFCIEFKSPKGNGVLSPDQSMILSQYKNNGFKTLVSNDYDHIIEQVIEYFRDVRIKCSYCPTRFISYQSLKNHIKGFHKM